MASEKKNLLLTGATGYIGGTILAKLLGNPSLSTAFNVTVIVRSPEKAEKLRGLRINAVVGSHSDHAFVVQLASEADIVIATADADDYGAAVATLQGLKNRYESTKVPPVLIHTSGTGVFIDDAKGMFPTEVIYDDLNPDQIETLAPSQPHRNVDLEIVKADNDGYVRTYIVLPSTIYGIANNKLVDLGIQNRLHLCSSRRPSTEHKAAWLVKERIFGKREPRRRLLEAILSNQNPGHGREGFYFGENGEHTLYDVGKRISEVLVELGLGKSPEVTTFTEEEIVKYFGGSNIMGTNSRCRANRSLALGWSPSKTTKDLLDSLRLEVEALAEAR